MIVTNVIEELSADRVWVTHWNAVGDRDFIPKYLLLLKGAVKANINDTRCSGWHVGEKTETKEYGEWSN